MIMFAKQVYRCGSDVVDGNGSMGAILGGKGAGLAEMTMLSVPVPPGFTVTTDVCRSYLEHGAVPAELDAELSDALAWLERNAGKGFGDANDPLLVSVRSDAPISMPGMMDTVLNVGLNDAGPDLWLVSKWVAEPLCPFASGSEPSISIPVAALGALGNQHPQVDPVPLPIPRDLSV